MDDPAALILVVIAVPTVTTIFELASKPTGDNVINVDVYGHQWWWQFDYTDADIAFSDTVPLKTANELVIPVDTPVYVTLMTEGGLSQWGQSRLQGLELLLASGAGRQAGRDPRPGRTSWRGACGGRWWRRSWPAPRCRPTPSRACRTSRTCWRPPSPNAGRTRVRVLAGRAGGAAPRRHPRRAADAAGGGLRARRGDRPAARRRSTRDGPLPGRPRRTRRRLGPAVASVAGRNARAARRPASPRSSSAPARRAPRRLRRPPAGRSPNAPGERVRSAVASRSSWRAGCGAPCSRPARGDPLPADTESRIGQFTELMATAIANAEARAEVARLADEQAALRRVATLVAQGARPTAVFDAVPQEVADLLDASAVSLARYDDDVLTVVAQHGARLRADRRALPARRHERHLDRAAHGTHGAPR